MKTSSKQQPQHKYSVDTLNLPAFLSNSATPTRFYLIDNSRQIGVTHQPLSFSSNTSTKAACKRLIKRFLPQCLLSQHLHPTNKTRVNLLFSFQPTTSSYQQLAISYSIPLNNFSGPKLLRNILPTFIIKRRRPSYSFENIRHRLKLRMLSRTALLLHRRSPSQQGFVLPSDSRSHNLVGRSLIAHLKEQRPITFCNGTINLKQVTLEKSGYQSQIREDIKTIRDLLVMDSVRS